MGLTLGTTLMYYKRPDIQEALVHHSKDKEIAFRFTDHFGKRPDTLTYPADVLELAKQKMTSLHCSEELWINPLQISTGLKKEELEKLRKGWDLVLDIDCKFFEYSRLAAFHTINALKANGVKSITAKFSGNKGFHIAVPFEAFPSRVGDKGIASMFPDAPRRIAAYITEMIRSSLSDDILKLEGGSIRNIIAKTGMKPEEITRYEKNEFGDSIPKLNVDPFLEIDTILISSRHMYRMPYSLHEKSGLSSIPLDINKVLEFEKEYANPMTVKVVHPFLDRNVLTADAEKLLRNAFDFDPKPTEMGHGAMQKERISQEKKEYEIPETAIPEDAFPPCIKLVFQGLEDGKKRMMFALVNFLQSCGWSPDQIEARLVEWNKQNPEPMREQMITGQMRYVRMANKKPMPPPSCNNPNYYKGIRVCKPDELCAKIKNPLQYAKRRWAMMERQMQAGVRANKVKRAKAKPAADAKEV
ncbi:hypothetical protein JW711_06060 [Candidatus Woesearchaeota archaeon]|nr:hypothetical protein [Candidatus Woesearchaeota archaeon]